jgi:hypothetical protein
MPAKVPISTLAVFLSLQEFGSGCCTVAAHRMHSSGLEPTTF